MASQSLTSARSPKATHVVIIVEQDKVILHWNRLPGDWRYSIETTDSPDMTGFAVLAVVSDTFFVDDLTYDETFVNYELEGLGYRECKLHKIIEQIEKNKTRKINY